MCLGPSLACFRTRFSRAATTSSKFRPLSASMSPWQGLSSCMTACAALDRFPAVWTSRRPQALANLTAAAETKTDSLDASPAIGKGYVSAKREFSDAGSSALFGNVHPKFGAACRCPAISNPAAGYAPAGQAAETPCRQAKAGPRRKEARARERPNRQGASPRKNRRVVGLHLRGYRRPGVFCSRRANGYAAQSRKAHAGRFLYNHLAERRRPQRGKREARLFHEA